MYKYLLILLLIVLTSCKIKFLEPDVISETPNSYYLTGDYIDLSKVQLTDQIMDEYLANGNGYMLCFTGNLTTTNLDIIIDYVKKSGKYIYLDLKNCTGRTTMRDGNFADLEYLAGIKLPHDVHDMGKEIFKNCINLTNVVLPLSLKGIRDYSFQNTQKLKEIYIPDTIGYMYQYAFKNCSLEIFIMPDNLKRLGVEGLMGALNLKIVVVNATFEWFRARCLVDTPKLETIIYYGTEISKVVFEGNSVFSGKPAKAITLYLPNVARGQADFSRWGGYNWEDVKYQGEFDVDELLAKYKEATDSQ
ncbi:leucine-rich repeat domain-containing protein [Brachyspira alvinipulli]|uniref:leucine-rich repeat domain-containing protein n=1 Tax=Brachyspira alvinipulli TaxID=84379 RepID=UPI003007BFFB